MNEKHAGVTRTSVSVTKGIAHPSGGTILHMPYVLAFSEIDLIYAIGSLNCSGVGRNVGQSVRPKGRSLGFEGETRGEGVFTEERLNAGETGIGGPSRKSTLRPTSSFDESFAASWATLALRAAMASVFDLRGARFGSAGVEVFAVSLWFVTADVDSSLSMGMAPSTLMSRQVVKVAAADLPWTSCALLSGTALDIARRCVREAGDGGEGPECIGHSEQRLEYASRRERDTGTCN